MPTESVDEAGSGVAEGDGTSADPDADKDEDAASDADAPTAAAHVYADWAQVAAAVEAGELEGEHFKPAGSGTEADPYVITTPEAFAWWAAVKAGDAGTFARLDADIDLTATTYTAAAAKAAAKAAAATEAATEAAPATASLAVTETLWTPIATLAAQLDGNNHAVFFRTQGAGLADTVAASGAIRWLGLGRTDAQLAAAAAQGADARAAAETSVVTQGARAGAAAGTNGGTVEGVVNRMTVTWEAGDSPAASSLVGGIVGQNDGRIIDCANLGTVENANASADSAAAGIAAAGAGTVETSYNAGSIAAVANGAYLMTALTADAPYEDLVDDASCYLAPGNAATYEGVSLERDGALDADDLAQAAERLNDGREGDAVAWRSAADAGDAAANGATRGYPVPAEPANPDAHPAPEQETAVEAAPLAASADDGTDASSTAGIYKNWEEVVLAIENDENGMGQFKVTELDTPITSPESFAYVLWRTLAHGADASFRLGADIDLSGKQYSVDGGPLPWVPYGVASGRELVIKGCGHTISGLYVLGGEQSDSIAGSSGERGLIGGAESNSSITVTDLTIEGIVGVSSKALGAGALVGYTEGNLSLTGVTSNVEVIGASAMGGLVGCVRPDGNAARVVLDRCVNRGAVTSTGEQVYKGTSSDWINVEGFSAAGGLIGVVTSQMVLKDSETQVVSIERSYNTGVITAQACVAGGIIGYAGIPADTSGNNYDLVAVSNTYNEGSVTSNGAFDSTQSGGDPRRCGGVAGGIYGVAYQTGAVRNVYNRGAVTSAYLAGGLYGAFDRVESRQCGVAYNAGEVTTTHDGAFSSSGVTNDGQGGAIAGYTESCVLYGTWSDLFNYRCDDGEAKRSYQLLDDTKVNGAPWTSDTMRLAGAGGLATKLIQLDSALGLGTSGFTYWNVDSAVNDGFPSLTMGSAQNAAYTSWIKVAQAVDSAEDMKHYQPAGEGTDASPYQVGTPEALAWVLLLGKTSPDNVNIYADLIADIDLSGSSYGPVGVGTDGTAGRSTSLPWDTSPFQGTFNGNGHTISNLYSTVGGLFDDVRDNSWVGGFTLSGDVEASGLIGGVAGYTRSGVTLSDIVSNVNVTGKGGGSAAAGVVGILGGVDSKIVRCGATGTITISNITPWVGGLVGGMGQSADDYAVMEHCYSTVSFTLNAAASYVGGLAGNFPSGSCSTVDNSYAATRFEGDGTSTARGALFGRVDSSAIMPSDLFYVVNMEGGFELVPFGRNDNEKAPFFSVLEGEAKTREFVEALNEGELGPASNWVADDATSPKNSGFPVNGRDSLGTWDDVAASGKIGAPNLNSTGAYVLDSPEDLAWYSYNVRQEHAKAGFTKNTSAIITVDSLDMTGEAYGGTADEPLLFVPIGNKQLGADGTAEEYPFQGATFDGGGCTIDHLRVVGPSTSGGDEPLSSALIGWAQDSTVQNVSLGNDCTIQGYADYENGFYVAGIVGLAQDTHVLDCLFEGSVTAFSSLTNKGSVGGIVGVSHVSSGSFSGDLVARCANRGSVAGGTYLATTLYLAGIVGRVSVEGGGRLDDTAIVDCYNTGTVGTSIEAAAGVAGIAAYAYRPSNGTTAIKRCYSIDRLFSLSAEVRAIAPDSALEQFSYDYFEPEASSCFAVATDATGFADAAFTLKTPADAKTRAFALALNDGHYVGDAAGTASTTWGIDEGGVNQGYPVFGSLLEELDSWEAVGKNVLNQSGRFENREDLLPTGKGTQLDPYVIGSPEAFAAFAYAVNNDKIIGGVGSANARTSCAKLADGVNVLDLAGTAYSGTGNLPWTPMGTGKLSDADKAFSGTFDGMGTVIQNLLVESEDMAVGLFGAVANATIENVALDASCSVAGTGSTNNSAVGGVVGRVIVDTKARIASCSNKGSVTGAAKYLTGGILGYAVPGKTNPVSVELEGCSNAGTVTGGGASAGGIAGTVPGCVMSACRNSGTVIGNSYAGGVAGNAAGDSFVSECTNEAGASVTGKTAGGIVAAGGGNVRARMLACANEGTVVGTSYAGGVAGSACGTVSRCYNRGSVGGGDYAGGIVGSAHSAGLVVSDCYNNAAMSPSSTQSSGGILGSFKKVKDTASVTLRYCYNAAGLSETPTADSHFAIVSPYDVSTGGVVSAPDPTVQDCYYNSNATNAASFGDVVNIMPTFSFPSKPVSQTAMQADTFVATLNANRASAVAPWLTGDAGNDGFPVLGAASVALADWQEVGKALSDAEMAGTKFADAFGTIIAAPELVDNVYQLTCPEHLAWLAYQVNNRRMGYTEAKIVLPEGVTELDMAGLGYGGTALEPLAWTPIGVAAESAADEIPFIGAFDGNGATIQHLSVTASDLMGVGLFGLVDSSIVSNVNIGDTCTFDGSGVAEGASVGSIMGVLRGTKAAAKNCTNAAAVTGGKAATGGIVGSMSSANTNIPCFIDKCKNTGAVSSTGSSGTGGLLGASNSWSLLWTSSNTGDVSGSSQVGGLAGASSFVMEITLSYNTGAVRASDGDAGGMLATASSSLTQVANNYNGGTVEAPKGTAYGFGPAATSANTSVAYSYYRSDQGIAGLAGAEAEPPDYMKTWSFAFELNGKLAGPNSAYATDDDDVNGGFPVYGKLSTFTTWQEVGELVCSGLLNGEKFVPSGQGTVDDPYIIETSEALVGFAYAVNNGGGFKNGGYVAEDALAASGATAARKAFATLATDINLFGAAYTGISPVLNDDGSYGNIQSALRWDPMGKFVNASGTTERFSGSFDGGGYTIEGMFVKEESNNSAGGFIGRCEGSTSHVTVKDITIGASCSVSSMGRAGGVVGDFNDVGSVVACVNAGSVSNASVAGGVVGYMDKGDVTGCSNSGAVSSSAGGLAGGIVSQHYQGALSDCRNSGPVNGDLAAGGIAATKSRGDIERCSNEGTITSSSSAGTSLVAGIVSMVGDPDAAGAVKDCFNRGSVSASAPADESIAFAAGIAAAAPSSVTLTNCYNAASVIASGSSSLMGAYALVGVDGDMSSTSIAATTVNCYYDDNATYGSSAYLDKTGKSGVTGKSTADMKKAAFLDLLNAGRVDDARVWGFLRGSNDDYPVFGGTTGPATWLEVGEQLEKGTLDGHSKPTGSTSAGFTITEPEQLAWYSYMTNTGTAAERNNYLAANITLTNDLDMSGLDYAGADAVGDKYANCLEWTPIGAGRNGGTLFSYSGIFDGGGHVLKNVRLTQAEGSVGLIGFGVGTIKRLGLESGSADVADASQTIGTIAAYCEGLLQDCYSMIDLYGVKNAMPDGTGALIGGYSSGIEVENCYFAGTLSDDVVGDGLLGIPEGSLSATNVYYTDASGAGDERATKVTESQLQSWGAAFALNGGALGADRAWAMDGAGANQKNGGYPVFATGGNQLRSAADWNEVGAGVDDGFIADKPSISSSSAMYDLDSAEDLAWFSYKVNSGSASYEGVLSDDIDLVGRAYTGLAADAAVASDFSNCLAWTPIGGGVNDVCFSGQLYGDKHTVKNLYVNLPDTVRVGLFGKAGNSAFISNVGIESGAVSGKGNVGGIVGDWGGGILMIGGCWNGASIVHAGTDANGMQHVGGIIGGTQAVGGNSDRVALLQCYNKGSVTSSLTTDMGVSGIAGALPGSSIISNCYNLGTVTGGRYSTGILGIGGKDGSVHAQVTNCYNAGAYSTASTYYGPIAGWRATVENCYDSAGLAVSIPSGNHVSGSATSLTTPQMKSWAAAYMLNGKKLGSGTAWTYDSAQNGGYPSFGTLGAAASWADVGLGVDAGLFGTKPTLSGTTYNITDAEGLAWVAYATATDTFSGKTVVLGDDIDLLGKTYTGKSSAGSSYADCLTWKPIGTDGHAFSGTLDGAGKSVKNVRTASSENYQGLVGSLNGGGVKNLTVSSGYVGGAAYVGGIVGRMVGGAKIQNCSTGADLSVVAKQYMGGIAGEGASATVESCINRATLTSEAEVGGIVGAAYSTSGDVLTIKNCANYGAIVSNGTDSTVAVRQAAGIFARNAFGMSSQKVNISGCYSTGALTAKNGGTTYGVALARTSGGTTTIANCAYDETVAGSAGASAGVVAAATEDMKTWAASYYLNGGKLGADGAWETNSANAYPAFGSLRDANDWSEVGQGVDGGFIGTMPAADSSYVYTVTSSAQLAWVTYKANKSMPNIKVKMTADVDLTGSEYRQAAGALPWKPIGSTYVGTFDGNSHVVKNLSTTATSAGAYAGLFAQVGGVEGESPVVKAVGVELAAEGVHAASSGVAGGLAGKVGAYATITDCYVLAGANGLATGAVYGSASGKAGGLAGTVDSGGVVKNSYAAVAVTGSGTLAHFANGTLVENCYYETGRSGSTASVAIAGATGRTAALMKSLLTAADLNAHRAQDAGAVWKWDSLTNGAYPFFGTPPAVIDTWSAVGKLQDEATLRATVVVNGEGGVSNLAAIGSKALSGVGTAASPLVISSPEALAWFAYQVNSEGSVTGGGSTVAAKSASVQLGADLDLMGTAYTGKTPTAVEASPSYALPWSPIGTSSTIAYAGAWDGVGHEIDYLYISSASSQVALFGYVDGASIKKMGIGEHSSLTGKDNVAAFVGACTVSATGRVTIENCYSRATVTTTSSSSYIGAFLGDDAGSDGGKTVGTIRNCYNAGKAKFAGSNAVNIDNCLADTENYAAAATCASRGGSGTKALTTEQMQSWAAAFALNGTALGAGTAWAVDEGSAPANGGYPVFADASGLRAAADWSEVGLGVDAGLIGSKPVEASNTFTIGDAESLAWFAYKVNAEPVAYRAKNVKLSAGIDLVGKAYTGVAAETAVAADFSNCLAWKPLGTYRTGADDVYAAAYAGTFDGGGFAVKNLRVNDASERVGLFGVVSGSADAPASVHDLGVESGAVNGTADTAGAIAGELNVASVDRCWNSASVTAARDAGGIVGYAKASVRNSYNRGAVRNTNGSSFAGGIVGSAGGAASPRVENCYNTGTVTSAASAGHVGAITGYHQGASSPAVNNFYLEGSAPVGFGQNATAGEATKLTQAQLKTWTTAYRLNGQIAGGTPGGSYVGSTDGTNPTATTFTTAGTDLVNDGYPVFGNLAVGELTVELDPADVLDGTAAAPAKKASGDLLVGSSKKTLVGDVFLLKAPTAPSSGAGDAAALTDSATVDGKFSTWGTDNASSTISLVAGTTSLKTDSTASIATKVATNLSTIDLHAAAAYLNGAARTTSFVLMDDTAGYRVTATIKGVSSKTLDVTVPVETASSFELSPDGKVHQGAAAATAATASTLKNNTAVPLAGGIESASSLVKDTVLAGGKKVAAVLKPTGSGTALANSTESITDDSKVKLYVGSSTGANGLTALGENAYFTPPTGATSSTAGTVPLWFAVPGTAASGDKAVSWRWKLDYTGVYIGADNDLFGFQFDYSFGLPKADVDAAALSTSKIETATDGVTVTYSSGS